MDMNSLIKYETQINWLYLYVQFLTLITCLQFSKLNINILTLQLEHLHLKSHILYTFLNKKNPIICNPLPPKRSYPSSGKKKIKKIRLQRKN